jgi:nicotinamidase-related amidase
VNERQLAQQSALLVMHVQPPLTEMAPETAWIGRIADAVAAARAAGIVVVYVTLSFRPGYPELPADSPNRLVLAPAGLFVSRKSDATHPAVEPRPGDIVVATPRVGAFAGTDLDILLRVKGISQLVLTGTSTGGVVLSTLVSALERDLQVTVLQDACADADQALHESLLRHFGAGTPWAATVVTTAAWIRSLEPSPATT